MFNINLTLLIQMVNFWLIFYIFTRWLWRPSLNFIIKEENEQHGLESKIATQERTIENNEQRRERLWRASRQQFAQYMPTLTWILKSATKKKEHTLPDIDKKEEDSIAQDVSNTIVSKVDHV